MSSLDTTASTETRIQPAPDLPPGTQVGEYRIEHRIGAGGMGTVYQAIHPVIDKRVAVKVLHYELCENADAVARFVQEARAVNRIGHPGIVDVFGFGTTEDGRAFLAMELLAGESLRLRLGRVGRLTIDEACDVLAEVALVLDAAHAAGIIHRDLKPDNIFLLPRRGIKLLDFGIAKLSSGQTLQGPVDVTQPGVLIGTPQYIAPEQARGLAITPGVDIYSLGVVAFEMVVGRPPFTASDPVELLAKHITLRPPAPSDFDSNLPEAADVLIGEMLDKDPERRPSIARIRELVNEMRTSPRSQRAVDVAGMRQQETKILDETAPPRGHRRLWVAVAACAITLAAGGVAWWQLGGSTDDAAPALVPPVSVQLPPVAPPPPPVVPPPAPVVAPVAEPVAAPVAAPVTTRHKKKLTRPPIHLEPKPEPKHVDPKPEAPKPRTDDDAIRSPFDTK